MAVRRELVVFFCWNHGPGVFHDCHATSPNGPDDRPPLGNGTAQSARISLTATFWVPSLPLATERGSRCACETGSLLA